MSSAITTHTGRRAGKRKGVKLLISSSINIDNGSGTTYDEVLLVTKEALTIVYAYLFYDEATDTTGAASANVKLGTSVGGSQLVAATALAAAQAVGARSDLTLASSKVAADGMIAVRHTGVAATEVGKYHVVVGYTLDK